jgi:hypothetical protein
MNLSTWVPEPYHSYVIRFLPDWRFSTWLLTTAVILIAFMLEEAHHREKVQEANNNGTPIPKNTIIVPVIVIVTVAVLWAGNLVLRRGHQSQQIAAISQQNEHPQTNQQQEQTTAASPKPHTKSGSGTPKQVAIGNGNIQIGRFNQGGHSIAQFGGKNNSATINEAPVPEFSATSEVVPSDKPGFVKTHLRIAPNIPIPSPVEIGLNFDNPVAQMGATVDGASVVMTGGRYRNGTHTVVGVASPGINPTHSMLVTAYSVRPVHLVGVPYMPDDSKENPYTNPSELPPSGLRWAAEQSPNPDVRQKIIITVPSSYKDPRILVTCDRACNPIDFNPLPSSSYVVFAVVPKRPELAAVLVNGTPLPSGEYVLYVESADGKPITVLSINNFTSTK